MSDIFGVWEGEGLSSVSEMTEGVDEIEGGLISNVVGAVLKKLSVCVRDE